MALVLAVHEGNSPDSGISAAAKVVTASVAVLTVYHQLCSNVIELRFWSVHRRHAEKQIPVTSGSVYMRVRHGAAHPELDELDVLRLHVFYMTA